ncbi:M20 metallopeptidase family protein [Dethiosulfatarculus sandiegensis]|uniref:Peptidase M20 n=1 Tax=Dethiosulfatarculus sandiegensis TaxID=1429043 RepID=A0A0D2J1T6_9BACT|nr:M20 family metallopeptidase [Dethiosulfatarculus sandiegensis]KIX12184.1 peptidase M20 [Dethiosulfatarculus sandiegensis]
MAELKEVIKDNAARIKKDREELHKIPEVAFTEEKTAAYVADCLKEMGLLVREKVAKTGVVGLVEGEIPGKTVMIRADMDALPVKEETGLSFASTHEGVMHACGHDCHMAMALGAARVLTGMREKIKGQVKFVFQPAEEFPGGAKPMMEEGVLKDPPVDYALGCHVWPGALSGTVSVAPGPVMAAMDRFDIKVIGKGGHGALPHTCIDPVDTASQVISALQRITSRHMSPLSPTVVTIGQIKGGTAFNVIADQVEMAGTTRTFDRDIWKSWPERLEKVVKGVCESMGASYGFDFSPGYPPTINDAAITELVGKCAAQVVGQDQVLEFEPTMGGEDMSYFLEKVPGCFFFLGAGYPGVAPLHNAGFAPRPEILPLGTELFVRAALDLLA